MNNLISTFNKFMRKGKLCLLGCLVLFLFSCRREYDALSNDNTTKSVYFSGSIAGVINTKAQGIQWNQNDSIGIFMFRNGSQLNESSIINNGFNKSYVTSGNGNFSPKRTTDRLEFPQGTKVDFLAYYPYRKSNSLTLPFDISEQKDQPALDFMVARNAAGMSAGQGAVALLFERQMTKIELKVKGADLNGLKAVFFAQPSTATFDLAGGTFQVGSSIADIPAKVSVNAANETVVEWTVFPGATNAQQKIVFTKADGSTYTWKMAANTSLLKGYRYQYDITLGKDGSVDPTPTAKYMEMPVITTGADLQYTMKTFSPTRRNYAMLYDKNYKLAYWVAYPLSKGYMASGNRTDAWDYDPDIDPQYQANLSKGYPAAGLDRGHQLPSADRNLNTSENRTTFYYTNMTPQNSTLNQGMWADLEVKIRTWVAQTDTIYVVTGAMVTTKTDKNVDYVMDNSNKQVAKPKYYYKALAMKQGGSYYTIGFKMKNEAPAVRDYMQYTTTVSALEEETGFTFFPALNKDVKSTINTQIWRK
ncbi:MULTISPECIES: DNA/RNA non-specific endonuclease [Elizabethkingia]|nr:MULTISPECIES: DNA/RNA non-specific endonuclease [Elizabethkingia]MDX8575546.1 DNA/RNA non-specific endonuclease [Elizabethkingia sp. HX WYD]